MHAMEPSFCERRKSGSFCSSKRLRTDLIVIGGVILQHAAQLRFVEFDRVIESFTPNRADEALDVTLLQWRLWRGRMIADPHCTNAASVRYAEGAIAVA